MESKKESDFQFRIQFSGNFGKSMKKIREVQQRRRINQCVSMLARGFEEWRRLDTKKIDIGNSSRCIRSVRVNDNMRLVFEGPIRYKGEFLLFIHDVCAHDEYLTKLKSLAKTSMSQIKLSEIEVELTNEEMKKEDRGLDEDATVFSKTIPAKFLVTPEKMDVILNSDKAYLLLTNEQNKVMYEDRPLLIHGQAGSGKTTLLCNRLALSISHTNQRTQRAFLTYNEKLVRQAEKDTEEILRLQYDYKGGLAGVNFKPLNVFLKQYTPNPDRFTNEKYVPYGRFKSYYEKFRRGNPMAKRVDCEVAWHGIRSILKGACVPPTIPPLSRNDYEALARKRRDFPDEIFDDIYAIGEWYQKEIINKSGLWDDQDLAWAALKWIIDMQKGKEKMSLYDEIFCDEGQDLTQIEFKILVSLCKPPLVGAEEGLPLVFAGDPLQTINPTGFKWSIIKNEVYKVQGRSVALHYLRENFRSDLRIVKFANYIQKTRSYYLGQPVDEQHGFEKDGDIPQIIMLETPDEVSLIQEKLGELNQIPDVAVIVWPEGIDEIEQFCKNEKALSKLDRTINPYSISEAKGLEFRLVVLYKFGSSDDMVRWKDYLAENEPIPLEKEIPLLYFLNRLYVAVTRAKSFLVLVDTPEGVENFLSVWKNAEQNRDVSVWPRADIRSALDNHPAFRGDSSDEAWREWAEELFDNAERTRDLRHYERARRAFEKAGETQNVRKIDARLLEIAEKWNDAGKLYFDMNEFEPARVCYCKAENWDGALKSSERLPTTPDTKRNLAIYRFKTGQKQDLTRAATEFFEYMLKDIGLDRNYLEELGNALLKAGDKQRGAQVLLGIARRFNDKTIVTKAAEAFYDAGDFESAEKLYLEAGETKARAYYLSRAENLLRKGDPAGAAKIFFENGTTSRVIEIFEQVQSQGNAPKGKLLELTADSYFEARRYDKALPAYKTLLAEPGRSQDVTIIGRIGECLEMIGDRSGAYNSYREARLYKKAADLGEKLGVAEAEINRLRTREAMENNDFEKAAMLARNSDDEKLVHVTAGQYYSHAMDFAKAIPEFLKAELWREAMDSFIKAQAQAGGHFEEELTQSCHFLLAVNESKDALDPELKSQIMEMAAQVEDDPSWENHIKPSEMGKIYEKCAHFGEAARYYQSRKEPWAKEGWLRVKSAQLNDFKTRGEFDKASQIEKEIFLVRIEQGEIDLTIEFNKEQTEILVETDKTKKSKELTITGKQVSYAATIAYYLHKHVPDNLKLVKPPFNVELPVQFSLLLVKAESLPALRANVPSYKLEDIAVAIQITEQGWVEKADEIEQAIKHKKDCFDSIEARSKDIKCMYLALEERRKAKPGMEIAYHDLSKRYLGPRYFSLRDSSSKMENPHEWQNFVHAATKN